MSAIKSLMAHNWQKLKVDSLQVADIKFTGKKLVYLFAMKNCNFYKYVKSGAIWINLNLKILVTHKIVIICPHQILFVE